MTHFKDIPPLDTANYPLFQHQLEDRVRIDELGVGCYLARLVIYNGETMPANDEVYAEDYRVQITRFVKPPPFLMEGMEGWSAFRGICEILGFRSGNGLVVMRPLAPGSNQPLRRRTTRHSIKDDGTIAVYRGAFTSNAPQGYFLPLPPTRLSSVG